MGQSGATGATGLRNPVEPTNRTNCRPEYSRPYVMSGLPHELQQFGDIAGDPPRFVFGEQLAADR